jgi:hypothetical protein
MIKARGDYAVALGCEELLLPAREDSSYLPPGAVAICPIFTIDRLHFAANFVYGLDPQPAAMTAVERNLLRIPLCHISRCTRSES